MLFGFAEQYGYRIGGCCAQYDIIHGLCDPLYLTTLICKAKRQCPLTCKVNRYCLSASHCRIPAIPGCGSLPIRQSVRFWIGSRFVCCVTGMYFSLLRWMEKFFVAEVGGWKMNMSNTRHLYNTVLMLGQRRRRWAGINTTLYKCLVFFLIYLYMGTCNVSVSRDIQENIDTDG